MSITAHIRDRLAIVHPRLPMAWSSGPADWRVSPFIFLPWLLSYHLGHLLPRSASTKCHAAIPTGEVDIKFVSDAHINTCHPRCRALLRHGAISSKGFRRPSNASGAPAAEKRLHVAPSAMPFRAGTLAIIAENGLGMPLISTACFDSSSSSSSSSLCISS